MAATKVRAPRKQAAAAEVPVQATDTGTKDRKTQNLDLLIEAAEAMKKIDVRSIPKFLREDVKDLKDGLPIVVQQQRDYIDGKVE